MKREWVFMTDETFYGEIWDVTDPERAPVVCVMPEMDDRPEDFALIARAPDLLDAARRVLETVEFVATEQNHDVRVRDLWGAARALADLQAAVGDD